MSTQAYLFPEYEVIEMKESLERMRKKLFAEQQEMKKTIIELTGHIEDLTWAVHEVTNRKDTEQIS